MKATTLSGRISSHGPIRSTKCSCRTLSTIRSRRRGIRRTSIAELGTTHAPLYVALIAASVCAPLGCGSTDASAGTQQLPVSVPAGATHVQPGLIVTAKDGSLWFTVSWVSADQIPHGALERIAADGTIASFDRPDIHSPLGLAAAPDGTIWFTDLLGAHSHVERFAEEVAIIVERYDRLRVGNRLVRVHQENSCKALAVHPAQKCQREGGRAHSRWSSYWESIRASRWRTSSPSSVLSRSAGSRLEPMHTRKPLAPHRRGRTRSPRTAVRSRERAALRGQATPEAEARDEHRR
jgi:hypothetical protein